jgi:hypothetical protein
MSTSTPTHPPLSHIPPRRNIISVLIWPYMNVDVILIGANEDVLGTMVRYHGHILRRWLVGCDDRLPLGILQALDTRRY